MKIAQLTPGTGSFHCGSCLRDLALTRALRRLGHDVTLVPLYLPLVDETDGSDDLDHVRLGGINVYLQQKSPLFRRLPAFVERLLDAPWLLRRASRRVGMTDPHELGELTLSMARGEHGRQVRELHKLIDALRAHACPGVIGLSNAMLIGLADTLRRELGAPIVCTLQGEDSFLDALPEPARSRSWDALAERSRHVDAFLAVSRYHGETMRRRLGIEPSRVHVVHNGIELDGYPDRPRDEPATPAVGYLAHLRPQKGLHTLVDAFILLCRGAGPSGLRLHVAGSATPADADYIAAQRRKLTDAGLADRVTFSTNLSRADKLAMLAQQSVLSVPATYGESFGLYVLEANAMGVPVVQPDSGAFPEVIEATGGGILCRPDDAADLADKLAAVLHDAALRRRLGAAGWRNVRDRFTDAHMARRVLAVMETACRAPSS